MSTPHVPETSQTLYRVEDGVVTRCADAWHIRFPRLGSGHHQLAVVWAVWYIWDAAREQILRSNMDCVVDVSGLDDLPLPLISVLSALDQDLRGAGRHLRLAGHHSVQGEGPRASRRQAARDRKRKSVGPALVSATRQRT